MAYVPVPYPQVLYDTNGSPVTVRTPEAAAALPATCAAVPTIAAALVAFPPALIAQIAKIPPPVAVTLPPALSTLIALNIPTPTTRKSRGDL